MTTGLRGRIGQQAIAGLLALTVALTLVPPSVSAQAAPDRFALTRQQDTEIQHQKAAITGWAAVGLQQENPASRDALVPMAVLAVEATLIGGYAQGLDPELVEEAVSEIYAAYSANRGSLATRVTPKQEQIIDKVMDEQFKDLKPRLTIEHLMGIGATTRRALEQHATIDQAEGQTWGGDEGTLTIYRQRREAIDSAVSELPLKIEPASPFYNDELPPVSSTWAGTTPAPQPSVSAAPVTAPNPVTAPSTAPAQAPSVAAAPPADPRPPTAEEYAAAHPDGIYTEHNGRVVTAEPDAEGVMQIHDYGEPEEDNKNTGNTKTRTGGDDNKKDKEKNTNSSGGGNGNSTGNSHSSGKKH